MDWNPYDAYYRSPFIPARIPGFVSDRLQSILFCPGFLLLNNLYSTKPDEIVRLLPVY